MSNNLLKRAKECYFIGIKGVGMTGLAQILKDQGRKITGSDTKEKFFTEEVLKRLNIEYRQNFNPNNIPEKTQLIIHSTAFNEENNPEMKYAKENDIPTMSYPEALSELFNESWGIAVTGTHGKTTTTALLAETMKDMGFDPSSLVGSRVTQWKSNAISGETPFFIIEADEHQNKLKYYNPWSLIITNIEWDHPDFYPREEDYYQAFYKLIDNWRSRNFLLPRIGIMNIDDVRVERLIEEQELRKDNNQWLITYGKKESDFWLKERKSSSKGQEVTLGVKFPDGTLPFEFGKRINIKLKTKLIGAHNAENLVAVTSYIASFLISSVNLIQSHQLSEDDKIIQHILSDNEDVLAWQKKEIPDDPKDQQVWLNEMFKLISNSLERFRGTERRMQFKGTKGEVIVFDDYAHHPKEVSSTISGVKESFPKNKLVVIFQPHTFSRTEAFLEDFANTFNKVLSKKDELILIEIYSSARETEGKVSSNDLMDKIKDKNIHYCENLKECLKYLTKQKYSKPTIILTMGAGDVWKVGEEWLKNK